MFRSWKLCTAFGIGIYVHWTLLLMLGWVFYSNRGAQSGFALSAVALMSAVFACVFLHELGHALMARRFGIGTRDITLYPIGGVARLERMSERPVEEFWIALAGPAVNVVIALGIFGFLSLVGPGLRVAPLHLLESGNFLFTLGFSNLLLVLFNLLPAFPMDGGRVLRALLSHFLGHLQATRIAASLGVILSVLLILGGIYWPAPMLMLIGAFVFMAGQQELAAVRYRAARRESEPIDLLPVDETFIESPGSPRPGFSGFSWDSKANAWVHWHNGRPTQTVSVD